VFNSVVLDPPASPAVLYTLHTPPHAIGEVAKDAGARALLLSHLSPQVAEAHDIVSQSIRRSYAGPVTFASDGMHAQP
jgi:ribonuclease BN (tRNA processing enzyme)